MAEEPLRIELVKIERATGAFIERRTYRCSCGHASTDIVKHLVKDHNLTQLEAGRVLAQIKRDVKGYLEDRLDPKT